MEQPPTAVERSEHLLHTALESPSEAVDALPEIVELLGHDEPAVRVNAAWTIGYVVHAHPSTATAIIPAILPYLREPEYQWDVARVLAYLAEEFRSEMKAALVDTATDEERAAINPFLARLNEDGVEIDPHDVFVLETLASHTVTDEESDDGADDELGGTVRRRRSHRRFMRADSSVGGAADDPDADQGAPADSGGTASEETPLDRDESLVTRVRRGSSFEAFELLDVVESHDYATVYKVLAETGSTETVVALKVFGEAIDVPEFTEGFTEQVGQWQAFDDQEHVVDVYEYGLAPRPWIAMEFMDGGDLAALDEGHVNEKVAHARNLIDAVADAHGHGLVHTGIKPSNVLFSVELSSRSDVLRIADWGTPKRIYAVTRDVRHLNPQYAAPEYFHDDSFGAIDQYTDTYHLGALLYRLFAGRPPFVGPLHTVVRTVLTSDPVPVTKSRPALPEELSEVLGKALAKNKLQRYETVDYLRADFERAMEGV